MRKLNKTAKQILKSSKKKVKEEPPIKCVFSTGSTELNLACSDRWRGAFKTGITVNIVGDESSGKTFLAQSILKEASINSSFDEYDLVYDSGQEAMDVDGIQKMFGRSFAKRLVPPNEIGHSSTIQEFVYSIWRFIKKGKPFIYIMDSLDSIDEKKELATFEASADSNDEKGSYGMGKAKWLSKHLGKICNRIERSESLLIMLSQTRVNISTFIFAPPKTRSCGKALNFYSWIIMWLSVCKKITKKINGKERTIGHTTKVKITKNKQTGKERDAEFTIYNDYGIDDIGSCIDWMVKEGFWKQPSKIIHASDLKIKATKDKLIKIIETKNLEIELRKAVARSWKEIEEKLRLNRKPKYT